MRTMSLSLAGAHMANSDGHPSFPRATGTKPLLLELPEEVLKHILLDVGGAKEGFLGDHPKPWERKSTIQLVTFSRAVD